MRIEDMQTAVNEAKVTLNRSDNLVGRMAELIAGRLRNGNVSTCDLEKLKRELRDYNIHTRSWKRRGG